MAALHYAHLKTPELRAKLGRLMKMEERGIASISAGGTSAALAERSLVEVRDQIQDILEILHDRGEIDISDHLHTESRLQFR